MTSVLETLCFEEMSEMNQSQDRKVDQDNHFKFNIDSITAKDMISIKLLLPDEEVMIDGTKTNTVIEPKILA